MSSDTFYVFSEVETHVKCGIGVVINSDLILLIISIDSVWFEPPAPYVTEINDGLNFNSFF